MSVWKQKATRGGEGTFPKAPPGNHPAVLVAIVDLGTLENNFNGVMARQHRTYLCWEPVCDNVDGAGDRNHLVGIELNLSLTERATLRQWVETRVGKRIPEGAEFDIATELGQPCLLSVAERNDYPKMVGVSAVPKGLVVPKPTHGCVGAERRVGRWLSIDLPAMAILAMSRSIG